MNVPPPPPGFQLNAKPATSGAGVPPPPPGFVVDGHGPVPGAYEAALADASQRSQFFQGGADPRSRYNIALRKVRESQFPDMTDEQWQQYSSQAFAPDVGSQADQSQMLGFSDELSAAIGGFGSQVRQWTGGGGPGFGESYGDLYELEQARLELARKQNGARGFAAELVAGAATMGPGGAPASTLPVVAGSRFGQIARAAVPLAAQGSAYGFGSTDGDIGERMIGARNGAGYSLAAGAAAPVVGKVIQGAARRVAQVPVNMANKQAMRQAVQTAPSAATIKAGSQAAYDAAEATGATISSATMQALPQRLGTVLRINGIAGPNGQLAQEALTAYPKVAHALSLVRQYVAKPSVTVKEAQSMLKAIRGAQKSADDSEAHIGNMLADQFESFMDDLPPAAFGNQNVVKAGLAAKAGQQPGKEAIQQWAKGRTQWARAKRTQTVENIIADARLAKGGFAAGLRSGFASLLKSGNAKKRRGFSTADLQAIERFVEGGPVQELLERIGSGAGLPCGLLGGLTGGPVGAVAVPVAGMGARRLTNGVARKAAGELRARVATPGDVPMLALPPPMPLPQQSGLRLLAGGAVNRGRS